MGIQQARGQAKIAEQNAELAQKHARFDEGVLRDENRRRLASSRAAFGASGLALTGTPIEVLANEASIMERDALLVRFGGAARARTDLAQASMYKSQAVSTGFRGLGQAGNTLLTYGQRTT